MLQKLDLILSAAELQECDAPGPLSAGMVRPSSHQVQGLLLNLTSTPIYFEKENGDCFMNKWANICVL